MQPLQPVAIRPGVALLAALVSALLLCWPALLNGGGFYFPDTGTYLRSADAIVGELTGHESVWSDRRRLYDTPPPQGAQPAAEAPAAETPAASPAAEAPAGAEAQAAAEGPLHPVLLGRSIYYGLAVFPFVAAFGSIGAVMLQAAFAVLTIWLTLAAFASDRSRLPMRLLAVTAVLAGLTSLPFFVSMLMPDVFAGFAIALAVAAAAGWGRLMRWERVCLALLLIFSAMAHSSHVLLVLALAGVTVLATLLARVQARAALVLLVLAAVSGLAGEQIFAKAVEHRLGEPPIRPPFLTARLIDDGPGFRLLSARCPAIDFEACRYLDRMPKDSDTFLWSYDAREGVFSTESIPVQRALAGQDTRFATESLRFDPLGVIAASAGNIARQAMLTDINIFNANSDMTDVAVTGFPEPVVAEMRASRYGTRTMPVSFWRWVNLATAIAGAAFLIAVLIGKTRERDLVKVRVAAGLFLAAIALNSVITGAMSKPHDRYNVRVIWVLQLAALTILATRSRRIDLEQK
jgi:hypothetical protein